MTVIESCVGVECIHKFVSDLKLTGEHFNRRNAMTATKRYNASRMYSCFRWRSNCKVALYAYFYPEKNEWRVSKKGVHNHTAGGPSEIRKKK